MALNNGEVLYGLRNLAVGDDEESRIADVTSEVSEVVRELINKDHHYIAYRVAIRESGIKMTLEECRAWANWWCDDECDPEQLANEMFEVYLSINKPDGTALSYHKIDDIEYLFVIDEGFSPAWFEQIRERLGEDYEGPFYMYKTNDEVLALVSKAPMSEDQRYAAEHPENPKM